MLLYIQDYVFNGAFVDLVYDLFGYNAAVNVLLNKTIIAILVAVFVLVVGWILVEIRAVRKLGNVIAQMEVILHKDNQLVELDEDFKEVEIALNQLKIENIRNEQLAQREIQRKNDLITYLAHDIKTPLASVIGYLSLLDEVRDMPEDKREAYTKVTLQKACRVEELINEFFEITRFNLSSIPLEKQTIGLEFMLAQMADEFYPMLQEGKRKISLDIESGLSVYADPNKLARVFNNIIKNAIAYSYPNTTIVIQAFQQEEEVVLRITNEGKEIPKDKLAIIFDKFYRLDEARSTNTGGAGLGLAIAKEIVTAHGGSIGVSSGEQSTSFIIKLPRE